ncbi:MAG TPA: YceI family protein [Saprospiraceae bacterium]|nr:YceI family protein [Saprospiraceae bacterium]
MKFLLLFLLIIPFTTLTAIAQKLFSSNGRVEFISDAPLEKIKAVTNSLRGVIDINKQEFAFTVDIKTFKGFNSPLQKDHFNENYMESSIYPKATYTGKLIDKVDLSKDGRFTARSKGWLNIHGVAQERIIKSVFEIKDKKLTMTSNFNILLQEYNINIPIIVHQKIAEEIDINVISEFIIK